MIVAALRSFQRIYRGLRPHQSDLETIIDTLKKHHINNKPITPSNWGNLLTKADPEKTAVRLRKFQFRKLQNTVEYVYRYIPHYKKQFDSRGIKPVDIQSLEDIRKLPITHRNILEQHQKDFISEKPGLSPIQVFKTSGTTGKPLEILLSADEFHYIVAARTIAGLMLGSHGPKVIYQLHFPLELSMDAILTTMAAQMAGSIVLNLGLSGTLEDHVKSIFKERDIPGKNKRVSTLFCSPAYLLALTQKAEKMGMDFNQSELKWIFTGGATISDNLNNRVRETWGVQLMEGYGMVETPLHSAGRCSEGHLHFIDFTGYIEVLDPETKEPASPGKKGVLVKTEFFPEKETMPLLRYWTQDLVRTSPEEICPCGNPTSHIQDIVGRVDQMVIIGGLNCYPQAIGDSLLGIPGLISPPRFTIRITETEGGQNVTMDVEGIDQVTDSKGEDLKEMITQKVFFADYQQIKSEAIKLYVNIVPPDSIEEPLNYKHNFPYLSHH